ncbi:MAG: NAD(P)/FAD-dependent oxidoreductase [Chitinophagales bacterium]
MKIDCLIIGQGICGSFLSWQLEKAGLSFLVIDNASPGTASRSAAGIINPITGRRMVKTWMIDELLPFLLNAYQELGASLGIEFISQKNIVDFFPTPQMREAFLKRLEEDSQYLSIGREDSAWRNWFNDDFGWGEIKPVYLVDMNLLLISSWNRLVKKNQLLAEHFDQEKLIIKERGIEYKGIFSEKIIFCDGLGSMNNPYFKNLPFAPNKGEALILDIENFPANHIFKKGISIVPWKDGLFWAGSSYEWSFNHLLPTEFFRKRMETVLQKWLKMSYKIEEHIASVRPATVERRPFVGFLPTCPQIGILNGMGTKGCSLAPYFAKQLVDNILSGHSIQPEADIKRFSGILSRPIA